MTCTESLAEGKQAISRIAPGHGYAKCIEALREPEVSKLYSWLLVSLTWGVTYVDPKIFVGHADNSGKMNIPHSASSLV